MVKNFRKIIIILLICTTFFSGCVMNVKYIKDNVASPCQHSISYEHSGFWDGFDSETVTNDKQLQDILSTYPESKEYLDARI